MLNQFSTLKLKFELIFAQFPSIFNAKISIKVLLLGLQKIREFLHRNMDALFLWKEFLRQPKAALGSQYHHVSNILHTIFEHNLSTFTLETFFSKLNFGKSFHRVLWRDVFKFFSKTIYWYVRELHSKF